MSTNPITTVFDRLRFRLERISLAIVANKEEAADVVQETFCRLWQIKERILSEDEATALAIKTVRNLSIDVRRKERYYETLESADASMFSSNLPADEALEINDRYEVVQRLISKHLSPLQQTILRMKEVEGKETDEIACKLNMSNAAVRMNLSRARNEIRVLFTKYYGE